MGDGHERLGPEFRAVALAEGASTLGDQLAKVAVASQVYHATGSAALAATALAATYLPDLAAGPLLSPLADRYPRRLVMVVCAVLQGGLALIMAAGLGSVPLVIACVVGIAVAAAPFKAAQAVTVHTVVPVALQARGQTRIMMIREVGQLAGLGASAVVVGLVGPVLALLINAASFALVAVAVWVGVKPRPAATDRRAVNRAADRRGGGWRAVWADPYLRALNVVVLMGTLAVLPEAVIIPLVAEMGAPAWVVGPLLAADVVGYLIGSAVVDRLGDRMRSYIGPMLLLALAPLALFAFHPGPLVAAAIMLASGCGAAYLPLVRTLVLDRVPDHVAGRAMGWMRTCLRAGQGIGIVIGGVLADLLGSPATAVAVAGTVAAVIAAGCLVMWARASTTSLRGGVA